VYTLRWQLLQPGGARVNDPEWIEWEYLWCIAGCFGALALLITAGWLITYLVAPTVQRIFR
jgi:hypothetical protein